ncbi:MAG: hypothetical protein BWK80_46735 [Desulfobacteraceae bacterium IS3]|nr:MAG: hypothetical protein BWK80_46735 [Desulfobacteraceae bacterium IS3]
MGVRTSTFGAVTLSHEDAEKFIKQIRYGRPKKAASKLLEQGRALLKQFDEQGKVVISVAVTKPECRHNAAH